MISQIVVAVLLLAGYVCWLGDARARPWWRSFG